METWEIFSTELELMRNHILSDATRNLWIILYGFSGNALHFRQLGKGDFGWVVMTPVEIRECKIEWKTEERRDIAT